VRRVLALALLAPAVLLGPAPAAHADTAWRALLRDHGGRLEGCLVAAPGERTDGWVIKVRGDNANGAHGHRFAVSSLAGGISGKATLQWKANVGRGDVSPAAKVKLPGASDWVALAMEDSDGRGGLFTPFDPHDLRRC
jgi:hypothetical protein